MSPKRKIAWLVAGALVLLASMPVKAREFQDIEDLQLFAPADVTPYDDQPYERKGFFFAFDGLFWAIQRPDTALIGQPGQRATYLDNDASLAFQQSTMNTQGYNNVFAGGNRFQAGCMGEEHGFLFEGYWLQPNDQYIYGKHVPVVFNDPPDGPYGESRLMGILPHIPGVPNQPGQPIVPWLPYNSIGANAGLRLLNLPTTFEYVTAKDTVDNWNVELSYVRRFAPLWHNGEIEVFLGARYMEFNENFFVETASDANATAAERVLADSSWNTSAQNHIFGPQIGGKLSHHWGAVTLSGEGRFCAGLNTQNIQQFGVLGNKLTPTNNNITASTTATSVLYTNVVTNLPYSLGAAHYDNDAYLTEFSPIVEARATLSYQFTKAIFGHIEWTGMWIDGIARPSSMVQYSLPNMGINTANNNQGVVVTGITVGVSVNR